LLNFVGPRAFVPQLPAPEPIEPLGVSLKVGCVAVNGYTLTPLPRSDRPSAGVDRRRADCCFCVPPSVSVAAKAMPAMDETQRSRFGAPSVGCDSASAVELGA